MSRRTFLQAFTAGLALFGITRKAEATTGKGLDQSKASWTEGKPRQNGVICLEHGIYMRYEHGKWFKGTGA